MDRSEKQIGTSSNFLNQSHCSGPPQLQEDVSRYVSRTCSREQQFVFADDQKFESAFGFEF